MADQRDIAVDLRLALPEDPSVGLQHQVGAGAVEVDETLDDDVVFGLHHEVGIRLQGVDRAGEHKASAALAKEDMRLEDAELVDHAVERGVVGVGQITLAAVVDDPALRVGDATAGIAVVDALREDSLQLFAVGSSGVVEDGRFVAQVTRRVEHARLLLRGHIGKGRAGGRHRHEAPAHLGIFVIDAFDKTQTIAPGRGQRIGIVIDEAVPAGVTQLRQHLVLLRAVELFERCRRTGRVGAAPVERGRVEIAAGAMRQVIYDTLGRLQCAQVDKHLAVDRVETELVEHRDALRRRELFEA